MNISTGEGAGCRAQRGAELPGHLSVGPDAPQKPVMSSNTPPGRGVFPDLDWPCGSRMRPHGCDKIPQPTEKYSLSVLRTEVQERGVGRVALLLEALDADPPCPPGSRGFAQSLEFSKVGCLVPASAPSPQGPFLLRSHHFPLLVRTRAHLPSSDLGHVCSRSIPTEGHIPRYWG